MLHKTYLNIYITR